ncbi:MAG: GNAT family N-acetyltransferase [Proteobacteria bacterium]|nr:GNAT family N-acetyltransferase [Pseudomonadota bacterium]
MVNVELTFDTARFDLVAIHAFLTTSYWARGIPRDTVDKAIAGSLCIGALVDGKQIGLARLVTDRATFAYLADVYVLPQHRRQGVSKRMLRQLFAHPDVQGLRRMMLATRDAHDLYRTFGFSPLAAPARFMERHDPDVYGAAPSGAA